LKKNPKTNNAIDILHQYVYRESLELVSIFYKIVRCECVLIGVTIDKTGYGF